MYIDDIDHVEFYVGDAQQTAYYMCTAFGFRLCGRAGPETGLPDQRSLLLRHGGIAMVLTSGLARDHPATEYVARHGDGVAKIAFRVADADLAAAEAARRGCAVLREPVRFAAEDASVTIAEVGGFGEVTHPLVARDGSGDQFLPGAMEMLPANGEPDTGLLHTVDHVAVCLPAGTLDETVHFYGRIFDLPEIFAEYVEVGRQAMASKVVQSRSKRATFTLIEPDTGREPGQIDAFLRAHGGAGVQHLAFGAVDIATAVPALIDRGVRFLDTPSAYYDRLGARLGPTGVDIDVLRRYNILVDRDHWGELFQIFTRSMHVRGTYFMEIIDRRGAETFGSGNIKALYEAVERSDATPPRRVAVPGRG